MAYSSKVANNLLFTPFDRKSNVDKTISLKLNEEEFCKHCYVEPDFTTKIYDELEYDENDECDYILKLDILLDKIAKYKSDEERFRLWINDPKNSKVYTISGNAGTGKTTFINYEKHIKENEDWIILDVALSENEIQWFGEYKTHISGDFNKAIKKVYSTILMEIHDLIFNYFNENDEYNIESIINNFESIVQIYNTKLKNSFPKGMNFMNQLSDIIKNDNIDNINKILNSAELFEKYFNGLKGKAVNEQLFSALDIMLLFIQCKNFNNNHIILFDSFERFISHDEIYNQDVDNIRKLLLNYSYSINKKGNCHKNKFKFIMVIRNSTLRMLNVKSNNSDELANNLDLTGWFNTNKMVEKKEQYLNKNCNISNETSDLLHQIIGDLRKCQSSQLTGLNLFIEPLFNNNKRLMIDFIGSYIELPSSTKILDKYNSIWSKKNDKPVTRYAARSIIRGILLQQIDKQYKNLFKELETYNNNGYNGLGHARKLLTILYNNNTELKLSELLAKFYNVKDIKKHWKKTLSTDKKLTIAKILFFMNSYNRRNNDWIQFIDIQLNNSNQNTTIKMVDNLYELLNTRLDDFTVSIMPSGEAFLKYIVTSFEYFSYRYCENKENYMPIFANIPSSEEIENIDNINELACLKSIKNARKYAIRCIKTTQNERDIEIDINHNNIYQSHSIRVINSHKGFINNFIDYILDICKNDNISETAKIKYMQLVNKCRNEIAMYKI